MKKLLFRFAAVLAIIGAVFMFSCEEPIPDCERYDYGKVIVKNETGYKAEVDVTWGGMDINDERIVYNNNSTTYYEVSAGSIKLWISYYVNDFGYDPFWTPWEYNTEYLNSCQDLTYRWYLVYVKKSTEPTLALDVIANGQVIETVTEFEINVERN